MHKNPLAFATWFNQKFPGRYVKLLTYIQHQQYVHRVGLEITKKIKPNWKEVYKSLKLERKFKKEKHGTTT